MECCEIVVVSDQDVITVSEVTSDLVILRENDLLVVVDSDIDVVIVDRSDIVIVDDSVGPAGPPGPAGTGGVVTAPAAENITAYKVVAMDSGGEFYLADPSILSDSCYVVGISLFSALTGESLNAQTDGVMLTPALWTPGPLFLGAGGTLTNTPPLTGFALSIATAATTTQLIVRPQFSIDLA